MNKVLKLNEHTALWNRASIRLLDIRRVVLGIDEELRAYRVPSSFFLYALRGSAEVELDSAAGGMKRFHVLHGGKGACLDIRPSAEPFEYVLVFYKAVIPLPSRQEILDLLHQHRPFQLQYRLVPHSSLALFSKIEELERSWKKGGELEHFHAKALFYQCVYELLWQLHRDGVQLARADLVSQSIRYMEEQYASAIALDGLADLLECSVGHLVKLFKRETGVSPIQYLTQIRLKHAKELLLNSESTLEEIAIYVGCPDKYYFGRMFKKHIGQSPIRFRTQRGQIEKGVKNPAIGRIFSIGNHSSKLYSGDENYYQHRREGELPMFSHKRLLATMLISLTLFLSACSGAAAPQGAASGNAGNVQASAEQKSPEASPQAEAAGGTRMIKTIKGDIEIPDQAQRVVVDLYLGSFIALDVKPVGTPQKNLENPYYKAELAGVENIGEYESISLEKILELQPDLIVTGNEMAYESFSKIAPTVLVPFGNLKTVHEEIEFFGQVLGKEQEAEAWLANFDKQIAQAREQVAQHVPAEATFSLMEDWGKTVGVFGDNFGRGGQAIYHALDRKLPPKHAAEVMKEQSLEISMEILEEYAGDYIIFTSETHTLEDLKADSIWGTLDAVKNDRVYIWHGDKSWYFDPIATSAQLEELTAWLVKQ
ncbi:AraC family transcriptional regulator [Paenibacillus sp. BIHB 4019]|uniref:AraC family transcriptional regulator n=1 Tax=Paenibacillus sp. BIHB 4019 TaxID=1870819 RepID=A0A1B2DDY0_9BACL|nr:AraC family transcriptional regulator [Paenibacillus sp. BIHB 4019]ANY65928.1 AraC family transcriptional regulator [Paenibacillus sp. BIHB 4019]